MRKQFSQDKAKHIINQILKNYIRLAFIKSGQRESESYRKQTSDIAEHFGLSYKEIQGSDAIIRKMIFGPWDDDFVIVLLGEEVSFSDFIKGMKLT